MAIKKSNKNLVPLFQIKVKDDQVVNVRPPEGVILNDQVYCTNFTGADWSGTFGDGDFIFIDPTQIATAGDCVAIYTKEEPSSPAIEILALSYMEEFVGIEPGKESNAIPMLSILRPNENVRFVNLSKLEKVHKIIGKACAQEHQNA